MMQKKPYILLLIGIIGLALIYIAYNMNYIVSSSSDWYGPISSLHSTAKDKDAIIIPTNSSSSDWFGVITSTQSQAKDKDEIIIPKEAMDPDSQYFGIIYKDTYGLPINSTKKFSFESFIKDLPNWFKYFPSLSDSFTKYRQHNPNKDPVHFSSSSSVLDLKSQSTYHVGDILKVWVQAKDSLNQKKTFGGDYFRARLLKVTSNQQEKQQLVDGIPCTVEDHHDGTYLITAILPFEGTFQLEVLLVFSVEGIFHLEEWTKRNFDKRFIFKATLSSKEIVQCNTDLVLYDRFKNKNLCDYSCPRNEEPWFCERPPSGICSRIMFMESKHIGPALEPGLISDFQSKFPWYQTITGSGTKIIVKSQDLQDLEEKSFNKIKSRYPNALSGYGHHDRWVSLVHRHNLTSLQDCMHCFYNKVVYMLGDSTMRQFFLLVVEPFNLILSISNEVTFWLRPRMGRNVSKNITIYMRSHGPPVSNPDNIYSRPYISDSFDGIKIGGKDVVVVMNIGLHTFEYDINFFFHRLRGIKAAVIRHLTKFPETKIIIKGMNISKLPKLPFEWLIHRYDVIWRETFKDLKNVVFVNLWDMTTVWPLIGDNHPPRPILLQQALLLFSYFCD